ncbi:MAG TPA: tautomerase family protein [Caldilineaceae bacterium]|mgnify:CR=1 FL=1|nr:tautomerase family protein [Caldilineaceae bacterium]
MAQIKVYGLKERLNPIKAQLSDLIHSCVVEALQFPPGKRAHRFFPLEREDFYYPAGRSEAYTIIEIALMSGRTVETKKKLISLLYARTQNQLGLTAQDLEISIIESPAHNWAFRGLPGDEVQLEYRIEV